MAIEDNLDQLYGLFVANQVTAVRLWLYIAGEVSKSEGISEADYLARQAKMAMESVDRFSLLGHPNPEKIREIAKAAIAMTMVPGIRGAGRDSPLQ